MPDYTKWTPSQLINSIDPDNLVKFIKAQQAQQEAMRAPLKQSIEDVELQHKLHNEVNLGNPVAIAAAHRLLLPYHGKPVPHLPNGLIDMNGALADIKQGTQLKQEQELRMHGAEHPMTQKTTTTSPTGEKVTKEKSVNALTGEVLGGGERVAETEAPNALKRAADFRESYLSKVKPVETYEQVRDQLDRAAIALNDPSPNNVSDETLVDAFVKITDPSGVIRQSKIDYVNEAVPWYDRAKTWMNKLRSDKNAIMDDATRQQFRTVLSRVERQADDSVRKHFSHAIKVASRPDVAVDPELALNEDQRKVAEGGYVSKIIPTPGQPAPDVTRAAPGEKETAKPAEAPSESAPVKVASEAEVANLPASVTSVVLPDGRVLRRKAPVAATAPEPAPAESVPSITPE